MRLLFLLVFIGLNAFSQTIDLVNFQGYQNSSLDTLTGELHLYFSNRIETLDLQSFGKTNRELFYDKEVSIKKAPLSLFHLQLGNISYFLYTSGGMVYKLDGDTIRRIDKSFDHRMQFGAVTFAYKNQIFKYGGYGFWSVRDFFTYFDEKGSEWEVYHPVLSKENPEGTYGSHYVKFDDEITIFGGEKIDIQNRRLKYDNNEVWTFDLKDKVWEFKGKHQPLELPYRKVHYGKNLLLLGKNHVTSIDLQSNKRSLYEHSPITAKIDGIRFISFYKEKFYLIIATDGRAYLEIVDQAHFFGTQLSEEQFYTNSTHWLKQIIIYTLAIAIILLVGWLIIKNFKKRNKLTLLDNGMRYRNKFTEFDMESIAIIKLLLSKPYVPSNQILKIVEKEQYSLAHNERIKVQKISDINLKIATLLGRNESIISNFKAENDRRIRVYKINKQLFS